jgi:hypothetical protein
MLVRQKRLIKSSIYGIKVTKGGRGQIRKVGYMATVSAIRANDNPFKARYQALIARGKPKKSPSSPWPKT